MNDLVFKQTGAKLKIRAGADLDLSSKAQAQFWAYCNWEATMGPAHFLQSRQASWGPN